MLAAAVLRVISMHDNNNSGAFTAEVMSEIQKILNRGNTVELKKEKGRIVVIEIKRTVKITTSITG